MTEKEQLQAQVEKAVTDSGKSVQFSNHEFDYVKATMDSPDFDKSLMEGYALVSSNPDPRTGLYLLRKPKLPEAPSGIGVGV